VNTVSGEVTLKNNASVPVNVDFYRIGSAAGALSLAGWNSLDDQNFSAVDGPDAGTVAGDSTGEGWDQAGGSNATQLVEEFVRSAGSTIAAGQSFSLGSAFNTSISGIGVHGDLVFSFGYNGGPMVPVDVSYVDSLSGDYNHDNRVNAADYVGWRKADINGAQGYIDWRTNFGTGVPGSGTSLSNAAVPEPGCCVLAVIALLGNGIRRRRRATI
jgi:hypothetical protein